MRGRRTSGNVLDEVLTRANLHFGAEQRTVSMQTAATLISAAQFEVLREHANGMAARI